MPVHRPQGATRTELWETPHSSIPVMGVPKSPHVFVKPQACPENDKDVVTDDLGYPLCGLLQEIERLWSRWQRHSSPRQGRQPTTQTLQTDRPSFGVGRASTVNK